MSYKRVLTIQDISCLGQCSLTVALPIISACGVEACILPSAVLSTHTGGFSGFTFRDLTDDMPLIKDHWKKENIKFDAFYTGYLGSAKQIEYVKDIFAATKKDSSIKIVDPAMADNGKLYTGFDMAFVEEMKKLCAEADYIIPNLTEACLLTDSEYKEKYDKEYIISILEKLVSLGCRNVIFTGVSYEEKTTGVVIYENGNYTYYKHEKLPRGWHGTGDVYASAFTGALVRGKTAVEAATIAADFSLACIKVTSEEEAEHWYGVAFEKILGKLISAVAE